MKSFKLSKMKIMKLSKLDLNHTFIWRRFQLDYISNDYSILGNICLFWSSVILLLRNLEKEFWEKGDLLVNHYNCYLLCYWIYTKQKFSINACLLFNYSEIKIVVWKNDSTSFKCIYKYIFWQDTLWNYFKQIFKKLEQT